MNNEKIDEMYEKVLEAADSISTKDTTPEEALETLESIKDEFETLSNNDIALSQENENLNGDIVMGAYSPTSGEITPTDMAGFKEYYERVISNQFNSFLESFENTDESSKKEINIDILKVALETTPYAKDIEDFEDFKSLIKRRLAGEKFNPYESFPQPLKNKVDLIIAQAPPATSSNIRMTKNYVSNFVLNEITKAYSSNLNNLDLDLMLSSFNSDVDKTMENMSTELGGIFLSIDDQRKIEIDAAIERCKSEGKDDGVKKLEKLKAALEAPYNLDDFAEFCKHVKIKKFDLEKPSRIFDSFNMKYMRHKNNINDISSCPVILSRHNIDDSLKLCLAFCKYAMNMSPDNIEDHTFMYYFIRNIVVIDRLNPKGNLYEAMDEKSKEFYDGFIYNLKKCVNNLIH